MCYDPEDRNRSEPYVVGCLDQGFDQKTLFAKIDFRDSQNTLNGIHIGEVLIDPIAETTIHYIECVAGSFSANELPLAVTAPVKGGGTGALDLGDGEKKVLESAALPVVSNIKEVLSGEWAPMTLEVQMANGAKSQLSCFYLTASGPGNSKTRYTFCCYPNHNPDFLKRLFQIDKGDFNYEIINVHLAKADPQKDGYAGVKIKEVTTSQNPHTGSEMPAPGETSGYRKEGKMYYLKGRVLGQDNQPRTGLLVSVMDKDRIGKDDLLGTATTDDQGYFELEWDENKHKELFFDKNPDLYFEVKEPAKLVLSTRDTPIKNAETSSEPIILKV